MGQDTCSSTMFTGINLYKRTNKTESDPRMPDDWELKINQNTSKLTFVRGLEFEVPLHEYNREYRRVRTGLQQVQPDLLGQGLTHYVNTNFADPTFPDLTHPGRPSHAA